MKIGIDIDDTITNTWLDSMHHYSELFGIPMEDLKKSKPYYNAVKEGFTIDEYFKMVMPIYDYVVPTVSLKENVASVLKDLHEKGHEIIFISSRGDGYTNAYSSTKAYLEKNNIIYDKMFLGFSLDKARVCLDEKVDLFIDDNYNHCLEVKNAGIKVLMFENYYNKDCLEFEHLKNWNDIYKYIK